MRSYHSWRIKVRLLLLARHLSCKHFGNPRRPHQNIFLSIKRIRQVYDARSRPPRILPILLCPLCAARKKNKVHALKRRRLQSLNKRHLIPSRSHLPCSIFVVKQHKIRCSQQRLPQLIPQLFSSERRNSNDSNSIHSVRHVYRNSSFSFRTSPVWPHPAQNLTADPLHRHAVAALCSTSKPAAPPR